jgi:integrase
VLDELRGVRAVDRRVHRGDPVFVGPRGGRLNRSDVSRDDHKAALEDGALRTSLRLDDLRHTAAASWLACGLPLIYAQRQLGHASLTTTEARYGRPDEAFLRHAAERVEQRIWRPVGATTTGDEQAVAASADERARNAGDLLPRVLPRAG